MKKLTVLMLVTMLLIGCAKEGPMGPKGDTGAQGPGGTNHQYTYTAIITPTTYTGSQEISCQELVVDIVAGNVSTVIVYAGHDGDITFAALPCYIPDNTHGTVTDLSYSVATGKVILTWSQRGTASGYTIPPTFLVYVTVVNK